MSPAADRGFLQFECDGRFAMALSGRRTVRLQENRTGGAREAVLLQFERSRAAVAGDRGNLGTVWRPRPTGSSPAQVPVPGGCVIDRYQYLLLMAVCLVVTLPLEFFLGARVYRRFRAVLWALVPVALVFSVWDVAGILRHHWSYNPRFVTGVTLGFGMPLEELVFFLVIPICGLLTYEAVGSTLARVRRLRAR